MIAEGNHEIVPLATIRDRLEAQFADMIKNCSVKVTELCKLEKETWQTVDTLNEKCEGMMNQVDTTKEKQVLEVKPGEAAWLGDSRIQAILAAH